MGSRRDKVFKVVTILVVVAIVLCALWIMVGRRGLVPGYENIVRDDAYTTKVPFWVHVVLFLGWGWLMYRLWVWIDKRK